MTNKNVNWSVSNNKRDDESRRHAERSAARVRLRLFGSPARRDKHLVASDKQIHATVSLPIWNKKSSHKSISNICLGFCRGMVSNSIITSCRDNICRIWTETIVPDDGLLHPVQEDTSYISMAKSARHKHKLLNKLHKMRYDDSNNVFFSKVLNWLFLIWHKWFEWDFLN